MKQEIVEVRKDGKYFHVRWEPGISIGKARWTGWHIRAKDELDAFLRTLEMIKERSKSSEGRH